MLNKYNVIVELIYGKGVNVMAGGAAARNRHLIRNI